MQAVIRTRLFCPATYISRMLIYVGVVLGREHVVTRGGRRERLGVVVVLGWPLGVLPLGLPEQAVGGEVLPSLPALVGPRTLKYTRQLTHQFFTLETRPQLVRMVDI